jgi:hypothetical protein
MFLTAEAATLAGRAAIEALMVDTVLITRATGETTFNETTGREEPAPPDEIYEGKCRVQRRSGVERRPEAGERSWTVESVELQVPVSAEGIEVGDTATITAAVLDPELVGREFRVASLAHKTHATARRLRVEEVTG